MVWDRAGEGQTTWQPQNISSHQILLLYCFQRRNTSRETRHQVIYSAAASSTTVHRMLQKSIYIVIDKWFSFRKCDMLPGQLDWYSWNRRFANCPISPIPCWQFSISTSASSITYLFKAWYHQINPSINQIRKRFIIKNKLAKLRRCATRVVSFRSKKSNQPTPVTNSLTKSEPPCSPPYLPPCPPN